jgi:hypothetical protein
MPAHLLTTLPAFVACFAVAVSLSGALVGLLSAARMTY